MLKSILKFIFSISLFPLLAFSQGQDYGFVNNAGESIINPPYSSNSIASWSGLPNSPNAISRSCCALVTINGTDYLYQFGGGNSPAELTRVARLNLGNNSWSNNVSVMPLQISSGTAIAMKGDSVIYVFGGNSPILGRTLRYNVYTNSWSVMATMPYAVTDAFVVKYNNFLIYVIGGGDGYFGAAAMRSNKVQVYNINTNAYTVINNYPINCAMLGGGIYRDTIIAVGGYTDGGNSTANCYKGVINPSTFYITWTGMQSYPLGPILRLASFVVVKDEGVGIACTGGAVNGSSPTSQTFLWNFCTQTWQTMPNNIQGRSNFKATGRGDNTLYTVAGYTTVGVGTTEKLTFTYIDGPCSNMVGLGNSNYSIPKDYILEQNYPNPFNPSTVISFGLPKASNVKLTVFDPSGKELTLLTDKEYSAGRHSIEFNAGDFSSGVYFYKIEARESGSILYSAVKKMVLIK
jgi:N-acetylneuraminic acid mutarotase